MERIPIVALDSAGADSTKTVPTYNPATGLVEWAAGGAAGGSIDALSDVDTSTTPPVDGDLLAFDASSGLWVPVPSPSLPAGGGSGQVLKKASVSDFDVVWADDLQGSGGGSGGAAIYPPDQPPSVPNAKDDEFDGSSTVTWTTTPTAPTATDRSTTRPGHLYIKTAGGGGNYVGRYQPVPAAYPYTITSKLTSSTGRNNYNRAGGIILASTAPNAGSNLLYAGAVYNNGRIAQRVSAQFNGTFVSQFGSYIGGYWGPLYIKVVVTSATSVSSYASMDGYAWFVMETGYNPGFTPGVMGLAINEEGSGGGGVEAFFDFFRVT